MSVSIFLWSFYMEVFVYFNFICILNFHLWLSFIFVLFLYSCQIWHSDAGKLVSTTHALPLCLLGKYLLISAYIWSICHILDNNEYKNYESSVKVFLTFAQYLLLLLWYVWYEKWGGKLLVLDRPVKANYRYVKW